MATADGGLAVQDRRALDPAALTPDTPEVISRQATVNIGTIGGVRRVMGVSRRLQLKAISGVQTVRFKNELERNITIKLGYANAKIYKRVAERPGPGNFCRRAAVVDARGGPLQRGRRRRALGARAARELRGLPGPRHPDGDDAQRRGRHGRGAAPRRGQRAVKRAAADGGAPRGLTRDRALKPRAHPTILQNKVDLVKPDRARAQHEDIRKAFVGAPSPAHAPVVPISAVLKYNIDAVAEYDHHAIPTRALRDSRHEHAAPIVIRRAST